MRPTAAGEGAVRAEAAARVLDDRREAVDMDVDGSAYPRTIVVPLLIRTGAGVTSATLNRLTI
jgi:hypothetical protein